MPRFRNIKSGPSEETLEKRFVPTISASDDARRVVLELGARLEQARATMLAREQTRIAKKYGDKSKQAKAAGAATQDQARMASFALSNAQRQRAAVVTVDDKGLVVHGRVVDPSRVGMPGLTVALVDARGTAVASTKTDANGYYKLDLGAADTGPPPVRAAEGSAAVREVRDIRETPMGTVTATRPPPGGVTSTTAPGAPTSVPPAGTSPQPAAAAQPPARASLVVLRGEEELHREEVTDLQPGMVRYREVMIKKPR